MDITTVTGDDISEAGTSPHMDDVVRGSVDYNGLAVSRSKTGRWKAASFIIGIEVAEGLAYFGISSNLISYLTGPLGQSTATAAGNVNAWNGVSMLATLLGAFFADSFFGRYRSIIIASLVYVLGLGFLSLSAALRSFNSAHCKTEVNNLACSPPPLLVIFFFFSLYLVAFAQGGQKPCQIAFGADQFDEEDEEELKAKSSFFNWWIFSLCGSTLVSRLGMSYIQENLSWELSFGILCISMCFALIVFLLGSRTYRFHSRSNGRNPFVRIGRVFMNAARNWMSVPISISTEEKDPLIMPCQDTKFRFLDRAILTSNGFEEDGNECSTGDIDDAKAILRLVPIWSLSLGFSIVYSQASTLFTKQGATMDRSIAYSFQIPAASLQSLMSVSSLVVIPIYDCILVPTTRVMTKKPAGISRLQRIGIGLFLSVLLMFIAAVVEMRRLATAVEHGLVDNPKATVPMSVWWLAPQYFLLGIADVFTGVGLQQFFYDQVPPELKSIGIALTYGVFGVGSFLSSFLIVAIEKATSRDGNDGWFSNDLNRAHLDYFYWLLAGLSTVTLAAYAYFARSYVYKRRDIV